MKCPECYTSAPENEKRDHQGFLGYLGRTREQTWNDEESTIIWISRARISFNKSIYWTSSIESPLPNPRHLNCQFYSNLVVSDQFEPGGSAEQVTQDVTVSKRCCLWIRIRAKVFEYSLKNSVDGGEHRIRRWSGGSGSYAHKNEPMSVCSHSVRRE